MFKRILKSLLYLVVGFIFGFLFLLALMLVLVPIVYMLEFILDSPATIALFMRYILGIFFGLILLTAILVSSHEKGKEVVNYLKDKYKGD